MGEEDGIDPSLEIEKEDRGRNRGREKEEDQGRKIVEEIEIAPGTVHNLTDLSKRFSKF